MRFGGSLSLACFTYTLLVGILGGTAFVPLLQQALGVLLVFFVFGRTIGEIGERVATGDVAAISASLGKEIKEIERETEILCGIRKPQDDGKYLAIRDVRPGQVLAAEVRDITNQILLPIDHTLDEDDVIGLIGQGVRRIKVRRPQTTG